MIGGFRSDLSITHKTDGNFGSFVFQSRVSTKTVVRAVCCKDQLRSCNIEKKNDFPKLCQNKGLGELLLKNISFRSLRFLFIFLEFFFVFCARSGKNWHRNRKPFSGSSRKLKKWRRYRKDQPRKSKDLYISSAYWRCNIWMKVEREFLTIFLNLCFATELTNSEFSRNSGLKKALWYMASHNETILRGRTIISTTRRAKNVTWAIWALGLWIWRHLPAIK